MPQKNKYKICLVGDSLSEGGAERVHAFLSVFFAEHDIEVHNVIVQDKITYNYSGKLLNLGKEKNTSNNVVNKFRRLQILKQYVSKHRFDYIIDFRMRKKPLQDWIISKFIFTCPTVYTVHHYLIDGYMPQQSWLTKAIYSKSYGVVSITDKIKNLIEQKHGLQNVTTIYNPVNTGYISQKISAINNKANFEYILAIGRMGDNIKQFDKLIEAYASSLLPQNNIKLVLLGEGRLKESHMKLAAQKKLSHMVLFQGFQENPYLYMRDALFFVLCSKFEGLPMVLLEALACNTPVISFDCLSGPSEIIEHKRNGLLVHDQDFKELINAMNKMYTDKGLYTTCKNNAKYSIEKFSLENIGRQWLTYLKIDTE